jgi:hypothetical protein
MNRKAIELATAVIAATSLNTGCDNQQEDTHADVLTVQQAISDRTVEPTSVEIATEHIPGTFQCIETFGPITNAMYPPNFFGFDNEHRVHYHVPAEDLYIRARITAEPITSPTYSPTNYSPTAIMYYPDGLETMEHIGPTLVTVNNKDTDVMFSFSQGTQSFCTHTDYNCELSPLPLFPIMATSHVNAPYPAMYYETTNEDDTLHQVYEQRLNPTTGTVEEPVLITTLPVYEGDLHCNYLLYQDPTGEVTIPTFICTNEVNLKYLQLIDGVWTDVGNPRTWINTNWVATARTNSAANAIFRGDSDWNRIPGSALSTTGSGDASRYSRMIDCTVDSLQTATVVCPPETDISCLDSTFCTDTSEGCSIIGFCQDGTQPVCLEPEIIEPDVIDDTSDAGGDVADATETTDTPDADATETTDVPDAVDADAETTDATDTDASETTDTADGDASETTDTADGDASETTETDGGSDVAETTDTPDADDSETTDTTDGDATETTDTADGDASETTDTTDGDATETTDATETDAAEQDTPPRDKNCSTGGGSAPVTGFASLLALIGLRKRRK